MMVLINRSSLSEHLLCAFSKVHTILLKQVQLSPYFRGSEPKTQRQLLKHGTDLLTACWRVQGEWGAEMDTRRS